MNKVAIEIKPLVSADLIPVADYVYTHYLSKPFHKKDFFAPHNNNILLDDQGNDTGIPRPNHGIAHSLRVASYIPLVIEFLRKYAAPHIIPLLSQINNEEIRLLQTIALFSVVGRKDETGFSSTDKNGKPLPGVTRKYRDYREASANAFKQYSIEANLFTNEDAGEFWFVLIREMGNTPWLTLNENAMQENSQIFPKPNRLPTLLDTILHLAHCIDLFRCLCIKDKTNPLYMVNDLIVLTKECRQDWRNLLQFSTECMKVMGNYVCSEMQSDGTILQINSPYNIDKYKLYNTNVSICANSINLFYYEKSIGVYNYSARVKNPLAYQWLIKGLYWPNRSLDDFILGITKSSCNQQNQKLRLGKHKKYTTTHQGVFSYNQKPKLYPYENVDLLKTQRSKHQSTTLITPNAQQPVFRNDKAGFLFNPSTTMINRILVYKERSYDRPYEAHTLKDAQNYYAKNYFVSSLEQLASIIEVESEETYEVLAKIHWSCHSSMIGIYQDNFEARCIAQFYADQLFIRLKKQFIENSIPWNEKYQIPIVYYIPSHAKHWTKYTLIDQMEDRYQAHQIIANEKLMQENFSKKEYAFLLLIDLPAHVLTLTYKNIPLVIILLQEQQWSILTALYQRANQQKNMIEQLSALLYKYSDYISPMVVDANGCNLLMAAATIGLTDFVTALLVIFKPHINNVNLENNSALYLACKGGHESTIRVLLEAGANCRANNETTELHLAAQQGETEIVQLLFNYIKDIYHFDKSGWTALHWAAEYGYTEIVRAFIDWEIEHKYPSRINIVGGSNKITTLHIAVTHGHTEITQLLLKVNLIKNINASSRMHYETALHRAVENKHIKEAKLLIDACANINCVNNKLETPMHLAVFNGDSAMVDLLLLNPLLIIDAKDILIRTALDCAFEYNHNDIAIKLIRHSIKAGIDLSYSVNIKKFLPLAISANKVGLVKSLLTTTVEVTLEDIQPNHSKEINKLIILGCLNKYINNLSNRPSEYTNFFNFGYSKTQKMTAALKLKLAIQQHEQGFGKLAINKDHFPALRNGELSKIFSQILILYSPAVCLYSNDLNNPSCVF